MSLKEDREGTQGRNGSNTITRMGVETKRKQKKKAATKRNDVRIGGGYASRDETSHY